MKILKILPQPPLILQLSFYNYPVRHGTMANPRPREQEKANGLALPKKCTFLQGCFSHTNEKKWSRPIFYPAFLHCEEYNSTPLLDSIPLLLLCIQLISNINELLPTRQDCTEPSCKGTCILAVSRSCSWHVNVFTTEGT
jgi:hypothetical protein